MTSRIRVLFLCTGNSCRSQMAEGWAKALNDLRDVDFDYVVTVCDYVVTVCGHARETCPVFPGKAKIIHRWVDDPPKLGKEARDEEEVLGHYRRVRDEIRAFVETLPKSLTEEGEE